jgi:integrase
LALGLGAGLSSLEIRNLRGRDILVDDQGVQLRVEEGRPRKVQVLARWEQQLVQRKKQVKPAEYVIAPGRKKPIKNLITNFVERGAMKDAGPTTQRMRATWLVTHMRPERTSRSSSRRPGWNRSRRSPGT